LPFISCSTPLVTENYSLKVGIKKWDIPQWKDKQMLSKWFLLMIESHFQLHLVYIYLVAMECLVFCKWHSSYLRNTDIKYGQKWSQSFVYLPNALKKILHGLIIALVNFGWPKVVKNKIDAIKRKLSNSFIL
jgi:hypothetical protein